MAMKLRITGTRTIEETKTIEIEANDEAMEEGALANPKTAELWASQVLMLDKTTSWKSTRPTSGLYGDISEVKIEKV
jgi:hypothetical protein